jgi:hypothetical protein
VNWVGFLTGQVVLLRLARSDSASLQVVDYAMARASDERENAILVSFLENVFALDTPGTRHARNLLTPRLTAHVAAISGHFIAHVDGTLPPIDFDGDALAAAELE